MNVKKITSLIMLLSVVVMTYTGIMLFIAPAGRIANWANWELFGLSKEQYASIHTTFMVLFVFATILHLYYNWKPITSYMKNKARVMIVFTKDMIAALAIVLIFLVGTVYEVVPFSNFLNFGEDVKESWESKYGTAPYSHAELDSLQRFCSKLGFDEQKSIEVLNANNIKYELTKSLSQIAKENGVSPQFIYELLKKNFQKEGQEIIELTGLGKKQIKDVAKTLKLSTKEFLTKLESLGIEATGEEKFKDAVERYDLSPMDVMVQLGYKKPQ